MATEGDQARARRLFELLDTNGSGMLERPELEVMVKQLGMKMKKKDMDEAMLEMDKKSLGFVKFPNFAKWWGKQKIGYRVTDSHLWTPRGTRISLRQKNFLQALETTGVAVHNLRAPTQAQLRKGKPTPEVLKIRTEGMEKLRMDNMHMVLDEWKRLEEAEETAADEKKVAAPDPEAEKIAAMLASSTERVEQIMAAQKAREAMVEAEGRRRLEKANEQEQHRREAETRRLLTVEERQAERQAQRAAAEEKTEALKASIKAASAAAEKARDDETLKHLAEGEARVQRIAKKRAVAEKRKAAARARQAARKAERVQAMQEEAQRQREEAAAISLERSAEAEARIRVQKEQQREEVLARNREKREALEARLNISAGDAIERERAAQRDLAEKQRAVMERNEAAAAEKEAAIARARAGAAKAEAERRRKAEERARAEVAKQEELAAAMVEKEAAVAKARHRALMVTQAKVERSRLAAAEKQNYVERMSRIEATEIAKMREESEIADAKTREWLAVRQSLKERQQQQMVKLLLNEHRDGNSLYSKGGGSPSGRASVPVGGWEAKRGWDLSPPNKLGLSSTGFFDDDGNHHLSGGRLGEGGSPSGGHGSPTSGSPKKALGSRQEWESEFLQRHGRRSLSPGRASDFGMLDAGKLDFFGTITGGRTNRIKQSTEVPILIDRSKVFNQSWASP